jgi:hypothetical protein
MEIDIREILISVITIKFSVYVIKRLFDNFIDSLF